MDQPHVRALLAEVDQARPDPLDSLEEVKPGYRQDGNVVALLRQNRVILVYLIAGMGWLIICKQILCVLILLWH